MNHEKAIRKQRINRRFRVRKRLKGSSERPRLHVSRSLNHIYCQVIDDSNGKTIAAASTIEKELASQVKTTGNCDAAKLVGKTIAERAKAAGISAVCFDRGRFAYHGRVAALAESARENGMSF